MFRIISPSSKIVQDWAFRNICNTFQGSDDEIVNKVIGLGNDHTITWTNFAHDVWRHMTSSFHNDLFIWNIEIQIKLAVHLGRNTPPETTKYFWTPVYLSLSCDTHVRWLNYAGLRPLTLCNPDKRVVIGSDNDSSTIRQPTNVLSWMKMFVFWLQFD